MPETKAKLECQEIFALLSEYLDEEVSPEIADCIASHIAGCEPCVAFIESLRKSVALCREYRSDATPRPLPEDVRNQLRESYRSMLQMRKGASTT